MTESEEYHDLLVKGADMLTAETIDVCREYFEDLIDQYPEQGYAYIILGGIYRELGMYKESEVTLQKAIDLTEEDYFSLTQLGLTLLVQNRFREAEELFRRSMKLEPDDVTTMTGLAEVLIRSEQLHEAQELLTKCATLEPDNYLVWNGLGNIYREQAEYEQSLDAFRRASLLDPANAYAIKGIADAHLHVDELEQAQRMYERALDIDPEYFHAKLGLAETFLKMKEYGICDGYLGELMDEDPSHCRPWFIRGQIHLNMGDLQQAEDCFNECISRNQYDAEAYRKLLTVYERADKVEEAEMTRGRLQALSSEQDIIQDTGLDDIDPSIREYVAELNSLGLQVHSARVGSPRLLPIDDPDPATIYFWADYKDAQHHIFTVCNMANWEAFYDDNSIGAVYGGETTSEISNGWVTLVQMARLVMPHLKTYRTAVQDIAWERDLRDEPERDED